MCPPITFASLPQPLTFSIQLKEKNPKVFRQTLFPLIFKPICIRKEIQSTCF